MARFHGKIGYVETEETAPGVYEEVATERPYFGDIVRNYRRFESSDQVNQNVVLNNSISVIADSYCMGHFSNIRYVVWMGSKWKVTNVEIQRPRITLTLGDVYNGSQA